MPELHRHVLAGTAPEPLSEYLKALGIFRCIATQADEGAHAGWQQERLVLETTLDRQALCDFFLLQYSPSPLVAPWNGGSGFWPKDNQRALAAINSSEVPRFAAYRSSIETCRSGIRRFGLSQRPDSGEEKERFLAWCRSNLVDEAVTWMDAAAVVTGSKPAFPAVLGTGGNDGRFDFTLNFMQQLVAILATAEGQAPPQGSGERLLAAIFAKPVSKVGKGSFGFLDPGAAGLPNSSSGGVDGHPVLNPWDYVMTLEGALLFAGSASRRLGSATAGQAAFPFHVQPSPSGFANLGHEDAGAAGRAELWLPLWTKPASFPELEQLFAEGRASLGRRGARTGIDFAQAVAGLGVDRGIAAFSRYGLLQRNGKAYVAAPLERFEVHGRAHVHVLGQLDSWLATLRRATAGRGVPSRYRALVVRLDEAIWSYCARGGDLTAVLRSCGAAQRELALGSWARRAKVPPLPRLRGWLHGAVGRSPELSLARSLVSLQPIGSQRLPFAAHLEATDPRRRRWLDAQPGHLWTHAPLVANLEAILRHRTTIASANDAGLAPLAGRYGASLSDVVAWLDGRVDDDAIADLVWALLAVDGADWQPPSPRRRDVPDLLPAAYGVLKLTLAGRPLRAAFAPDAGVAVHHDTATMALLSAGRTQEATQRAIARLRAAGLRPLLARRRHPGISLREDVAFRLGAALLFPLSSPSLDALAHRFFDAPDVSHGGVTN